MSTLEVPLQRRLLRQTQEAAVRAFLDLELKDSSGNWRPTPFRVDNGADVTQLPAATAKALGLPMPLQGMAVSVTTSAGAAVVELRPGLLRFRVPGMGPAEHVVPCHFVGDPDPPPGAPGTTLLRNLLALSGTLAKLRFTFDGTPAPPAAPAGRMVIEAV
jgi:hypothetical protein